MRVIREPVSHLCLLKVTSQWHNRGKRGCNLPRNVKKTLKYSMKTYYVRLRNHIVLKL